jgi:hypothetical protein
MDMDVTTRAMLVDLTITSWSSNKLDKDATNEVLTSHGAKDEKGGRFTKALVAKDAMAEIKKISTAARMLHKELTLPWSQEGSRILPTTLFSKYDAEMKELKDKYEVAVNDFIAIYPKEVDDAKARLGGLFRNADYPSVQEVADKFSWQYAFMPLPRSDDFRVQMSEEISKQLKLQYEAHAQDQIENATKSLYDRAYKVVSHMVEKLNDYGKPTGKRHNTFHATLVTNARELADLLNDLNITNDQQLTKLANDIKEQLCEYDAEYLKEDPLIRERVSTSAKKMVDELKDKLGAF